MAGIRPLAMKMLERSSTRSGECRKRHAINLQKPLLFLRALGNIDIMRVILDAEFLECAADFVAVGGAAGISSARVRILTGKDVYVGDLTGLYLLFEPFFLFSRIERSY